MPAPVDWSSIPLTKEAMTPAAWADFDRFTDELARILVERGISLSPPDTLAAIGPIPAARPALRAQA